MAAILQDTFSNIFSGMKNKVCILIQISLNFKRAAFIVIWSRQCPFWETAVFHCLILWTTALPLLAVNFVPESLTNNIGATVFQVISWCCQVTNHYLKQCWPSSMTPYGVIRGPMGWHIVGLWRKSMWKCCLQSVRHFVHASICQLKEPKKQYIYIHVLVRFWLVFFKIESSICFWFMWFFQIIIWDCTSLNILFKKIIWWLIT